MGAKLRKIGETLAFILSILFLIVFFGAVLINQLSAEAPFGGNLLPGWDCETPMAISSGAWPNTVLVVYRTTEGEWIFRQFWQSELKKDKPFYSEHCPNGIPAVVTVSGWLVR